MLAVLLHIFIFKAPCAWQITNAQKGFRPAKGRKPIKTYVIPPYTAYSRTLLSYLYVFLLTVENRQRLPAAM